jgi:hypothetical protein
LALVEVVDREREKERRHKERRESLWSAYWPSLGKEIGRGRKNIKNKKKKKKKKEGEEEEDWARDIYNPLF